MRPSYCVSGIRPICCQHFGEKISLVSRNTKIWCIFSLFCFPLNLWQKISLVSKNTKIWCIFSLCCFPLNLYISSNYGNSFFLMRALPKLTYMLAPDQSKGLCSMSNWTFSLKSVVLKTTTRFFHPICVRLRHLLYDFFWGCFGPFDI